MYACDSSFIKIDDYKEGGREGAKERSVVLISKQGYIIFNDLLL